MKRLQHILILLLATSLAGYSQETIRPEISVIPPSPNAAAINKFVDIPVSYYTGTPNVSIPLFTLDVEGMSLPISLDYHASGLKVEETASNVGAGWRLNAGGVITRSIHGLPDEVYTDETVSAGEQRGWFQTTFAGSLWSGTALNWTWINGCSSYAAGAPDGTTSKPIDPLDHLAGGNWDLEPDMYHLSFPGGSSKFIFERDGDLFELMEDDIDFVKYPFTNNSSKRCTGCSAISQDSDPTNTNYSFIINDQNGISYSYEDVERTTAVSGCFPNDPSKNNGVSNRQSAWYLSSMYVGSRAINFSYADETIVHESDYYETQQFKVPGTTGTVEPKSSICLNDLMIIAKRLDTISTSNGYQVIFVPDTEDRDDLQGSFQIKEIIVKYNEEVIKHYRLIQSYFGSNDKLRLDEVQVVNPQDASEILNKYVLDYFTGTFPAMDSKKQDYWGFYNGASNLSMIPEWKDENYHVNYNSSVNREPSLIYARVGTLSKITYPTGGYTLFDYELNDFYDEDYPVTQNYSVSASDGTTQNLVEDEVLFTLNESVSATLNIILPGGGLDGIARLEKHNGTSYQVHNPPSTLGNRVTLVAGDYRLYAASGSSNTYSAEVEYELTGEEKYVSAGGLRIRKMTFYDPVTAKNEYRYFRYTEEVALNTQSSGKLYTDPRIGGYITSATTGTAGGTCIEDNGSITSFVNLSQISQIPLGVSQGSPVAYTKVTTFKSDLALEPLNGFTDSDKINGETVYTYTNEPIGSQLVYPPVPLEDLDYKNGKLKYKQDYRLNSSNTLEKIMEEMNEYEQVDGGGNYVTAYMFRKIANRTCYACIPANTINASYKIYRRWDRLKTKVETHIENEELSKSTSFSYTSGHSQTHAMQTVNSLGETIDYTFIRDSSNPGLITELTEERDNVLVRAEKVDYENSLPISYYAWDGVIPGAMQPIGYIKKQYIVREGSGVIEAVINSPLSATYFDDIASIYIRSYGSLQRAVAQITGISLSDLGALLNANSLGGIIDDIADDTDYATIKTKLNAIRQVLKPQHLMTSYLYDDEMGGIHGPTHIIDPGGVEMKYQYDDYGRLEYVFDAEDNLVRKISYNFKNN